MYENSSLANVMIIQRKELEKSREKNSNERKRGGEKGREREEEKKEGKERRRKFECTGNKIVREERDGRNGKGRLKMKNSKLSHEMIFICFLLRYL